jgi:hypothetical protein
VAKKTPKKQKGKIKKSINQKLKAWEIGKPREYRTNPYFPFSIVPFIKFRLTRSESLDLEPGITSPFSTFPSLFDCFSDLQ